MSQMGDAQYRAAAALPLADVDDDELLDDPATPLDSAERRDTDGTPVGSSDAREDAIRSGADPDDV